VNHLRKKNKIYKETGKFVLDLSINSGQGVQGRQRFDDESEILQVHRSITAAQDKVQKETLEAATRVNGMPTSIYS
jgi:hypothetical protein